MKVAEIVPFLEKRKTCVYLDDFTKSIAEISYFCNFHYLEIIF